MSGIALLIIDLQNAYFNNDALQAQQASLVKNTNMLVEIAHHHHLPVFNVRTEHHKDIASWTLNMLDDKQGYLFKGEEDVKSINGLRVDNTIEVLKTRDSAFHHTTLEAMLRNHRIQTLILCGVSTHTCILQTASDAYAANFRVILAQDAIATHEPKFHKNALTVLETEYRQRIMDMAQLKDYVQNNSQQNT